MTEFRDGDLYGASVACFTTTTWEGKLPTLSPYPRGSAVNSYGYRYTMEFDPDEYDKFQMAEKKVGDVVQVHFLLLQRSCPREKKVAEFLGKQKLVRNKGGKEDTVTVTDNQDAWEYYFPNGKPNDYQTDRGTVGRMFVNVMFWHAVNVTFEGEVEKRGPVFSYSEPQEGSNQWLKKLFQTIPDEKTKYLEQKGNEAARRRAKEVAKSNLQEEEPSRTIIRAARAIEKNEEEAKVKVRPANKKLEEEAEEKKEESALNEEKVEVQEPDEELKAASEDAALELSFDKLSIGTQKT